MISSEALDSQPVPGLSLAFILIFYAPLALVALVFFFYCLVARTSVIGKARLLSAVWLIACVPACLMILMGYAFNPSGKNIFLQIPAWIGTGLVLLWFPVLLRRLFRIRPV